MLWQKKMFGNKAPSEQARPPAPLAADAVRRDFGPDERVLPADLFEGEVGNFLRQHGYAPDDPINKLVNQEPIAAQLAEGQADLRSTLGRLNAVGQGRIGALQLLPPLLWHGKYGDFLLKRLDLSPYRPWNVIFLPLDETGARTTGLPILPANAETGITETLALMTQIVVELFQGDSNPEADAMALAFAAVRGNFPFLFPPDRADFSGSVRDARANVRALAFMHGSTEIIDKDVILRSQQAFLAQPEIQLTN